MIKRCKTLQEAKNEVYTLIQKPIKVAVNRGRNKVEKYNGTIVSAHPNLFMIKVENNPLVSSLCCSYKEIICGEVKIKAV
ncbi:MAG: hypothetical protein E7353_03385 [Clostridiales bacterium]|nr:hypothetical protein [Clostridiales bacterium]